MLDERPLEKLSDGFGDYTLVIRCQKCLHTRVTDPHAIAKIVGWNTEVRRFAERLRCTNCGATNPRLTRRAIRRPRGVPKNPH